MNCSLYESELVLDLGVVMDSIFWFTDRECARLTKSRLRAMALCRTIDHGWVGCPGLLAFVPICLYAVSTTVALTASSRFILALPPYPMVNLGIFYYKKKINLMLVVVKPRIGNKEVTSDMHLKPMRSTIHSIPLEDIGHTCWYL